MARLTEDEARELLRATAVPETGRAVQEPGTPRPLQRRLTPLEYAEFATFAARFDRSTKPVRFGGALWKL
jgi:hypothetical protein